MSLLKIKSFFSRSPSPDHRVRVFQQSEFLGHHFLPSSARKRLCDSRIIGFTMISKMAYLILAAATTAAGAFISPSYTGGYRLLTPAFSSRLVPEAPSVGVRLPMGGDDAAESISIGAAIEELRAHRDDFDPKIAAATTVAEAEAVQVEYLGKKGTIGGVMSYMRALAPEDKPRLGAAVSETKSYIESAVLSRKVVLDPEYSISPEGEVGGKSDQAGKKKKKKSPPPPVPEVAVDISRLDIRVGEITKAWEHEEADKLFCEEIDLGEEGGPRQIASGLRAHYSVDDLVGRKVLVLANLKSRKLVGFPSHGKNFN